MKPQRKKRGAFVLASALLTLALLEGGFRLLGERMGVDRAHIAALRDFVAHGSRLYSPYPYTNYIAGPPEQNADDHPRNWAFQLRPHDQAPRIACLGGSTTWGLYPFHLDQRLEHGLGGPVEVMNWGVPGWNSTETMVNYFVNVQDYEPDVVILLHAINDTNPRFYAGYRTDLAHWRSVWTPLRMNPLERLLVRWSDLYVHLVIRKRNLQNLENFSVRPRHGPQPADPLHDGSQVGFERNMRTIAEHARLRGSQVVLVTQPYNLRLLGGTPVGAMVEQHNQLMRELARREGYLLVDMESELAPLQEGQPDMFLDHIHLSGAWQRREGTRIAQALAGTGWLEPWRRAPAPASTPEPAQDE